jgi:hypothetical protein
MNKPDVKELPLKATSADQSDASDSSDVLVEEVNDE